MTNKIKRKKQLVFILLLLFTVTFSYGQDTIVKKRYLDSVKNQLALYITGYYTYLNLYDRCENDKKNIEGILQLTQSQLENTKSAWKKQKVLNGIYFGVVGVLSLVIIYILKK